ncbi:Crp/Fnr family transcriptional regulator [Terriglobus tenax]|uniref:Crp/Fnr family transcriptional regulator n=1 Tax=Terriglobus tenax TaxID=1111115 RepID=UPI0021DF632F|nr:Crp/Fnr family transcriptional regulator [Terriglobus tenax]
MNRRTNRLLQSLPDVYRKALIASMEEVDLPVSRILYEAGKTPKYAHFVLSGAVSVVGSLKTGDGVEVFSVGREGLVEATHLLGIGNSSTRAFVQVKGSAARIPLAELQRHFQDYQPLRSVILSYVQSRTFILEQLSACNRHHEVEPRIVRWLLMMQDRIESNAFPITQEFLAELLGTRRTTVSRAAKRLQGTGLIHYSRGNMRIVNRRGLEQSACECYAITKRLAATSNVP